MVNGGFAAKLLFLKIAEAVVFAFYIAYDKQNRCFLILDVVTKMLFSKHLAKRKSHDFLEEQIS